MMRGKGASLRRQMILYWLGISMIMLAVFFLYAFYNIYRYREDFIDSCSYVAGSYANQLGKEMESLEDYVKSISASNTHFATLRQKNLSENTRIKALYYLGSTLENRVSGLYYTGGIFLYDRRSDSLRSRYSLPSIDEEIYEYNRAVKKSLKDLAEDGRYFQVLDILGEHHLVYRFEVQNLCLGYLIDLEDYLETTGLLEEDVQLAVYLEDEFVFSSGQEYIDCRKLEQNSPAADSLSNGMDWVCVCGRTEKGNLQLWTIYPGWSFFHLWDNPGFWLLFLVVPLIAICFFWNIYRSINIMMLRPIDHLLYRLSQMREEGLPERKEKQPLGQEFSEIYRKIDEMLDEIDVLQREKYEKELEANAAKLQYYQLQVNPHFFLNCLNNIDSMLPDTQKGSPVRGFIYALSHHFRYVFRDQTKEVTLAEEIEEVKEYCEISKMRLGAPILLQTDIEEVLLQISVPILSVQAFVENAVKYGWTDGKVLALKISAVHREDEGESYACIRISDNGKGYEEERLKALNRPADRFQYHSQNVGIDNVKYRLHLMYGHRARIAFYNDFGGGAVVELMLPLTADGEGTDESLGNQ